MKIAPGTVVELRYTLYDQQGELVEETPADEPVRFRHGDGEILPGLEAALEGLEAGAGPLKVAIAPGDAYGEYNPEGLVSVPRSELPEEHEYRAGDWISVYVEAEGDGAGDDEDRELEMRIVEVREDVVVLDANHPLAGQQVTFEVEVLNVLAD